MALNSLYCADVPLSNYSLTHSLRSKLDYGCVVYGSARGSYLRMLDPIQNHALRLCLGAFRTSPATSLCVAANEPPLELRRTKLSLQYVLKLGSNQLNPSHNVVFNAKFKPSFERKSKQIPPLSIRVLCDLKDVGFQKRNVSTPPWLLMRPIVPGSFVLNYMLYFWQSMLFAGHS